MSKLADTTDLQERLALAERALAESVKRLDELGKAVAEIARTGDWGNISKAKTVVIDADTVSPFCTGFYQREYDPADRPYRWTGRGSLFELRIPVDRSFDWNFAMELQRNAHVDISRLRAYVDYIEIPRRIEGHEAVVRGTIPARPLGRQAVMTFQLPNMFVPKEINPESSDARTLGVVFYELRATPSLLDDSFEGTPDDVERLDTANFLRKARSSLAASVARAKSR